MNLLFVYNAKSDGVNKLIDFAHKIISPSTYSCDLCTLTHHDFGARSEWKSFLNNPEYSVQVYYNNEFENKFTKSFDYPVILKKEADDFEIMLDRDEIAGIEDLPDLLEAIFHKTQTKVI